MIIKDKKYCKKSYIINKINEKLKNWKSNTNLKKYGKINRVAIFHGVLIALLLLLTNI